MKKKEQSTKSSIFLSYPFRSLADRRGITVDVTTSFLHSSRFSAFRRRILHSKPVHSLMLPSHRFLCLMASVKTMLLLEKKKKKKMNGGYARSRSGKAACVYELMRVWNYLVRQLDKYRKGQTERHLVNIIYKRIEIGMTR